MSQYDRFCSLLPTEWLTEGKIKKLVLALCDVNSKEPLECWEFRIVPDETGPAAEKKQQGTKDIKEIQQVHTELVLDWSSVILMSSLPNFRKSAMS